MDSTASTTCCLTRSHWPSIGTDKAAVPYRNNEYVREARPVLSDARCKLYKSNSGTNEQYDSSDRVPRWQYRISKRLGSRFNRLMILVPWKDAITSTNSNIRVQFVRSAQKRTAGSITAVEIRTAFSIRHVLGLGTRRSQLREGTPVWSF